LKDKIKNIGIIAFVPDIWSEQYQSRHHILKGLSKEYKVIWVSEPLYFNEIKYLKKNNIFKNRGLKKVSETLLCYASYIPADYKRKYVTNNIIKGLFRFYNKIWKKCTIIYINYLKKIMSIDETILYIWRPEYQWAMGCFKEKIICYHVDDEYSFNSNMDNEISEEEYKVILGSDLVFIHSNTLLEKKGHINQNTHYVPNGVDYDYYQKSLKIIKNEPNDIIEIPHPRIGYMGHIKRHINLELLLDIASKRKEWSFVMIGPVREEHEEISYYIEKMKHLKNVHFLGGKKAEEIPMYLKYIDICVMPYHKTNYTKYIYPMKMHEYFACGKPVVSTELENLKEYSKYIEFAESSGEWINIIEKLLKKDCDEYEEKNMDLARLNSWQKRIDKINIEIKKSIYKKYDMC
jgi:hypothetical protein